MATQLEAVTETTEEPLDAGNEQPEIQREPLSTDDPAPEGEEPQEEGEEQQEEQAEPIAAPTSWAKDAKEVFSGLPREAQEIIANREAERERFVQAKSREVVTTRQAVENEARTVIQQLARNHEQAWSQLAGQFEPQQPDIRLLQSGDPQHQALYMEQDRQYRISAAQRDQFSQQAQQARQLAEQAEMQQRQDEVQAEISLLTEKVPEWSDPSERAKLLTNLEPIAAELGYSAEVMAQARAADILALRTASTWRDKASKYDQLMKNRMQPVRAAKQIPPAARPGAPTGMSQSKDAAALLYPEDQPRR